MIPSLSIRIPRKLRTQLQNISRKERVPISDLVRESLSRYIAVYRFRKLRAKALPHAGTLL